VLDSILIEHASRAGAHFETHTRVDGLLQDGETVCGAVLQTAGGQRSEIRAPVVIGADGKSSKVAEWVGAAKYDAVPALRPAYYGYFRGIEPRPEATVEVMFGGEQIGFLFPMREGEDCVAIELQPEEFEEFRSDHEAAFKSRLSKLPDMARRMKNAELEGKLNGVKGIENYFRKPYGPGWALTGDAGHLKDPSTGTGIGDALEQSFMLAEALGAWFDGAPWESTMAAFQQKRDKTLKTMYDFTLEFTRMRDIGPAEVALLQAVLISPSATRVVAEGMLGQLSSLLSPPMFGRTTFISRMFAPSPETTKT
jgi:flavin-dependent dehydrogenase